MQPDRPRRRLAHTAITARIKTGCARGRARKTLRKHEAVNQVVPIHGRRIYLRQQYFPEQTGRPGPRPRRQKPRRQTIPAGAERGKFGSSIPYGEQPDHSPFIRNSSASNNRGAAIRESRISRQVQNRIYTRRGKAKLCESQDGRIDLNDRARDLALNEIARWPRHVALCFGVGVHLMCSVSGCERSPRRQVVRQG